MAAKNYRVFSRRKDPYMRLATESKVEHYVHDLEKTVPWPWSTKALDELITSSRASYLSRN